MILCFAKYSGSQHGKTCAYKSKPISVTNVAFTDTLGLLLCRLSMPYKMGAFDISKQRKGNKSPIIYWNPLKQNCTGKEVAEKEEEEEEVDRAFRD